MSPNPPGPERTPPELTGKDFTSHDGHGYRHGLGPCHCEACKKLRPLRPRHA